MDQSALGFWESRRRRTEEAGAGGGGVFAGATDGLDLEGAALDFTYFQLGVGAAVWAWLLAAARHALRVLGDRVLGHEVGVDAREHLGGRVVLAQAGHVVGDGRVGVGEVRVEGFLGLRFAVLLGRVVGAVVCVVEATGGGGEGAEAAHCHAAGAEGEAWYGHDYGWVVYVVGDAQWQDVGGK